MIKVISDTNKPVKIWASDLEAEAERQVRNMGNMPFIHSHVAVMPDAHAGKGSTVGTVIASNGAIIPAAVGVDIGCGMASPGSLTQGAALAPESMDKKMKKSVMLARAEQEYKTWAKREQFESFMAKHMPSLTKGEVSAIGQTLALRKSLRAERKLAKMVDMGQDSYVNKKEK
jgi:RNA-splicing ligase RtcB